MPKPDNRLKCHECGRIPSQAPVVSRKELEDLGWKCQDNAYWCPKCVIEKLKAKIDYLRELLETYDN